MVQSDCVYVSTWEISGGVVGGEASNGEQRSSCIRGTARAQGSTWRTEPSDLRPAISPRPLLLSRENTVHKIHRGA